MTRIWRPRPGLTLPEERFDLVPLPREGWATGDYVLAEVIGDPRGRGVEVPSGRIVELAEGDLVIGAFGSRFATQEATGSWLDIPEDGGMHLLGGGGLFGSCRTISSWVPRLAELRYRGHLLEEGAKLTMPGESSLPHAGGRLHIPVVLLTGTSMSAGKTTAARVVVRRLRLAGHRVLGAKLTGAGRFRDILGMADAGADAILDFVDAGLPSTHCPEPEFEAALERLLAGMARVDAGVAVAEIGASPLEPYNGTAAIRAVRDQVVLNILCGSDPYAVAGAIDAYGITPDLVTGTVANTEAGIQLVERLTGLLAVDLRNSGSHADLDRILARTVGTPVPRVAPQG